jgi:hypothetical protein
MPTLTHCFSFATLFRAVWESSRRIHQISAKRLHAKLLCPKRRRPRIRHGMVTEAIAGRPLAATE